MNRGVLYITWPDDPQIENLIERSRESLRRFHPELPVKVCELPAGSTLLDKARMWHMSPWPLTLYLDADTVVMQPLDFGFEQAIRYGIACCICECPYARRFADLANEGDIVEYNTGVIFFQRNMKELFGVWASESQRLDSSMRVRGRSGITVMPCNDQASFAKAVHTCHYQPSVLPLNWNFRPQWHKSLFGPIKIWHDYSEPTPDVLGWNESQTAEGSIIDFAKVDH